MSETDDIKLQKIAQRIIDNMYRDPNDKEFGSIILIIMIIGLVLTLIRIIQECNTSRIKLFDKKKKCEYFKSEIQNLSFKKTWFTKRIIKKAIRKQMSREHYNKYGIDLMNALLISGETVTDDESITLVEAANV